MQDVSLLRLRIALFEGQRHYNGLTRVASGRTGAVCWNCGYLSFLLAAAYMCCFLLAAALACSAVVLLVLHTRRYVLLAITMRSATEWTQLFCFCHRGCARALLEHCTGQTTSRNLRSTLHHDTLQAGTAHRGTTAFSAPEGLLPLMLWAHWVRQPLS